ncbi:MULTISPECIES: ABC transporter permease [Cohnella]|uniref:ABC transporter permease n=1 Tax=Cohnella TaxID=329857 RepID=UPI0009BA22E6|nr:MULTISPECIES: ABC-2 family transporter protein [Cohnella]MBN2983975.1 ABC-2 family transporter protein [Cohnella algarum]
MAWLSTFRAFVAVKYKQEFEYRSAFLLSSFSQMLSYAVDFLLLWILVSKFQTLLGWNRDEIVFLYALQLMSYAIAGSFFFGSCMTLSHRIQSGDFDGSLTLPVHPLAYEIMSNFSAVYLRHFALAFVVLAVSIANLDLALTPAKLLMLILCILGGALIQGGSMLFLSAPSFRVVRGERLISLFFFEIINFIRYPISIFPVVLKAALTFILPYAFINYYPAHYLLDKEGEWEMIAALQFLTPVVGFLVFGCGVRFWNRNLKKYQSTGS